MPNQVFIYYYFLEEDEACLGAMRDLLGSKGWSYTDRNCLAAPDNIPAPAYYELKSGNVQVLVLYCRAETKSWQEIRQKLTDLEKEAGVIKEDLLGQVQVLIADDDNWESAREELSQYVKNPPLSLELMDGEAWRSIGSRDPIIFLAHFSALDLRHAKFFGEYLPLIELTVIRLQMISRLMRDRNQVVIRERMELDDRLKNFLHLDLVTEDAKQGSVIDEYEKHLNLMSSGYGKIVNDFSLILDGYHRLTDLLQEFQRQVALEPSYVLSDETLQLILLPFNRRLAELDQTLDDLRLSRESHQAAIDVTRSRIDLLMSKENIETQTQIRSLMETNTAIQRQSLTFQFAAGLIEFIVLAYYSHSLWKNLAPGAYDAIASWIQLVFVLVFSGVAVYLTHLIAEWVQGEKHIKKRLLISLLIMVITILAVLIGSVLVPA